MVTMDRQKPGGAKARRAPRIKSVQLKFAMAVSGVIFLGYLVAHMLGNLKIFFGQESLDLYAHFLRIIGEPLLPERTVLTIFRVVLLAALVAHMYAAIELTRRAKRARPVKYAARQPVQGSYAARTMRWGGVIIFLFVVFHILDLTVGVANPNGVHGEVYNNIVAGFAPERWYVTLFYTLAIVAVTFHVRHGLWSALRSLGQSSVAAQRTWQVVALVLAVALGVGFLSVPFAVTFGLVG
jgi:succinate dehydrogenase / fumarate reductase, cytochrome b subunit